jgi:hypothetical protein
MLNWKELLLRLAAWAVSQVLGKLLDTRSDELYQVIDEELAHSAPDPGLAETIIAKSIEKITGKPATSTQIGAVIMRYSPIAAAKAEQAIVAHLNR